MDGLTRQQVERLQGARIGAALLAVAAQRGYAETTVAEVVERAGVSRRTFYALYDSRDDALAAACRIAIESALRRVYRASGGQGDARASARAALAEIDRIVVEEPGPARVCLFDAPRSVALRVRAALVEWMERLCAEFDLDRVLAPMPREDLAAALVGVLVARLEPDPPELEDLVATLEQVAVAEPPPQETRRPPPRPGEPPPDAAAAARVAADVADTRRRAPAIRARHDLMVDAAVHGGDDVLRAICDVLAARIASDGELTRGHRQAPERLGELCRAALSGGPAGALALAGYVRPRGRPTVQGLALRLLRAIVLHPGLTGRELQDLLGVGHASAVSRSLGQLERRGLVRPEPGDRGAKEWHVTTDGRDEAGAVHGRY